MRSELALCLLLLAGCPRERGPLLDLSTVEFVDAADDPFSDRPGEVTCPPASYTVEVTQPLSLEVDTGGCNYLTVTGPLLLDLGPKDLLTLYVGHDVLTADEPATAHVAIQIGDWVAMDRREPIPNLNNLLSEELTPSQTFKAGTPVYLHLHNHGENTWNLYEPASLDPSGS